MVRHKQNDINKQEGSSAISPYQYQSHKGIARRALPISGGKDAVGENKNVNKGE